MHYNSQISRPDVKQFTHAYIIAILKFDVLIVTAQRGRHSACVKEYFRGAEALDPQ
jgi:hypothetical protein